MQSSTYYAEQLERLQRKTIKTRNDLQTIRTLEVLLRGTQKFEKLEREENNDISVSNANTNRAD